MAIISRSGKWIQVMCGQHVTDTKLMSGVCVLHTTGKPYTSSARGEAHATNTSDFSAYIQDFNTTVQIMKYNLTKLNRWCTHLVA